MRLTPAHEKLRWAIVPTAGRGTRMRPATDVVPKVLLPIGIRPMLDWAFAEALDAGVEGIIVVVAPDQRVVRDFVEASSGDWPTGVELHLVEQPTPAGLGDALIRCRAITADDSFGVVVPDNWFDAPSAPVAQVAGAHFRTGMNALGLVSVDAARAALLGNVGRVELDPLGEDDYRIRRLGDKGAGAFSVEGGEAVLRGCARYVLGPDFYEALEATGPPQQGEWDDVPAFQHLTRTSGLVGHRIAGEHFDVGQAGGYLEAQHHVFERDYRR